LQLEDYPVVLGGVHQALRYYNHTDGDGTTADLRSLWGMANLRAEVTQNEYLNDPFANVCQKPRVHTVMTLVPTTIPFANATDATGVYRIYLGQLFAGRRHIRALHFWYQTLYQINGVGTGTTMVECPILYSGLQQVIYQHQLNNLDQASFTLEQDGEVVFQLDNQGSILENNTQYQNSVYGVPKVRPIPCVSVGPVPPATGPTYFWDSQLGYPLLLNHSSHTHKPDYSSEEVHPAIVDSPVENLSSATKWCVEYNCKNTAILIGKTWRGEWVVALEATASRYNFSARGSLLE